MRLKSMTYSEFEGAPRMWTLASLDLQNINLIVGRNATGKSRSLNVINALAMRLSRIVAPSISGSFNATFENKAVIWRYRLHFELGKVSFEQLTIGSETVLERNAEGVGFVKAIKLGQPLEFQVPEQTVASVAKQDKIQHPFLVELGDWARATFHYQFGSDLGKSTVGAKGPTSSFDPKDPNHTSLLLYKAIEEHGQAFKSSVMLDMAKVGYDLEDIGVMAPLTVDIPLPLNEPFVTFVKEKNIETPVDQFSLSTGMYRALAIIIQVNYGIVTGLPQTILIDDIGEGLDHDRARKLIEVLVNKANAARAQLIMTTNDRFVMNAVDLDYWTVLVRDGAFVSAYNRFNRSKEFEDFKFTGLSNFDFLARDFITRH